MKIVTHKGGAHRDEFVACCLLLASVSDSVQSVIERRDPTPEELEDVNTYVVDVGERHEPAKNNFDHHQQGAVGCALTMVLDHLGLLELARSTFAWIDFSESLDCRGPYATAAKLGISKEAFFQTLSPVEAQMLQLFEQEKIIHPGMALYILMRQLGAGWLRYLEDMEKRLALLPSRTEIIDVNGVNTMVVDIDGKDNPVLGLEQFCQAYEKEHGSKIGITITRDDRGDGYALFRREDHPRVDFRPLTGRPDMVFVHTLGFMGKTKAGVDPIELVKLGIK